MAEVGEMRKRIFIKRNEKEKNQFQNSIFRIILNFKKQKHSIEINSIVVNIDFHTNPSVNEKNKRIKQK